MIIFSTRNLLLTMPVQASLIVRGALIEFQRLHGMETLIRPYSVKGHPVILPCLRRLDYQEYFYLVRRLLENGAMVPLSTRRQ